MAAERIEAKQQEIDRFREGLKGLQSQIAELSEEVMSSGELDDLTGLVHGALTDDSSHMERKRVLAALVAEIVIRPGKQVDITLNVPSRQTGGVVHSSAASQTPGTGVRMETTLVEARGFETLAPCRSLNQTTGIFEIDPTVNPQMCRLGCLLRLTDQVARPSYRRLVRSQEWRRCPMAARPLFCCSFCDRTRVAADDMKAELVGGKQC